MFVEIGIVIILSMELVPGFLLFPGDTLAEKVKIYREMRRAKTRKS